MLSLGDGTSSFEQIVKDHQAMVFRTLLRLTGRGQGVDDLAQEVFLRLFRALPSFRGEALISTYLYRIVVNVAQDEWKRRQRAEGTEVSLSEPRGATGGEGGWCWEDRLEHPGRNAEQALQDDQFQQAVEAHFAQLSAAERSVLVLFHQEDRTYVQIAESLGMPIGTVRTHLHRGRGKLRDALTHKPREPQAERSALAPRVNPEAERRYHDEGSSTIRLA